MKFASMATTAGFFLWVFAALLPLPGVAQDKPSLSEEIRRVIDSEGIDAGKRRFAELYPSQADAYTADMQSMMQLGQEYMGAGDMDTAMVVMEMAALFAQDMANQMYTTTPQNGEIMKQMAEQKKIAEEQRRQEQAVAHEQEQRRQQKAQDQSRGKSRDDLARFTGMYTDPDNANRTLFVTESCDGYLVAGPMWADVGPWWMRSAADRVFTYADSYLSFSMEFETDGEGRARRMRHELDGIGSPVTRSGELPDDWEGCMERPLR